MTEDREDWLSPNRLLPAWFTGRLMSDDWTFGLLTDTGHILVIERITSIEQSADGELWLDVQLSTASKYMIPFRDDQLFTSPTSRTEASIAARHIVAAFELADT